MQRQVWRQNRPCGGGCGGEVGHEEAGVQVMWVMHRQVRRESEPYGGGCGAGVGRG